MFAGMPTASGCCWPYKHAKDIYFHVCLQGKNCCGGVCLQRDQLRFVPTMIWKGAAPGAERGVKPISSSPQGQGLVLEQHPGRTVLVPPSWRGPGRWFGGKTTHMSPAGAAGWDFQADAWLQGPLPAPSRAGIPALSPPPAPGDGRSCHPLAWQRGARALVCGRGCGFLPVGQVWEGKGREASVTSGEDDVSLLHLALLCRFSTG